MLEREALKNVNNQSIILVLYHTSYLSRQCTCDTIPQDAFEILAFPNLV